MTALIAEVQIKKATIEKLMGSNGRFKKVLVEKNEVGSRVNLGPHDAGFDFRLPDHIGGFQTLNADLALQ
jgi:hypothetical protein